MVILDVVVVEVCVEVEVETAVDEVYVTAEVEVEVAAVVAEVVVVDGLESVSALDEGGSTEASEPERLMSRIQSSTSPTSMLLSSSKSCQKRESFCGMF